MAKSDFDLSVDFCGFQLKNPFLLASAPPTATGAMIKRAFKDGWAGAVLKTTLMDPLSWTNVTPRFASLSHQEKKKGPRRIFAFENIELGTMRSHEAWFRDIEALRKSYPDRLIVASIMGDAADPHDWQALARQYTSAGAHMIELNMSCPHGLTETGGMGSAVGQNAELSSNVTRWVKGSTEIPIIPKMTANAADVAFVAKCCVEAGADAISGINTLAAITGVDLETMVPLPDIDGYSAYGGLSGPAIKPIALKAVAGIAATVNVPISGIGGISTWEDATEFLLLGASCIQLCTAVMTQGYDIIRDLQNGLGGYLQRKNIGSVSDLVGVALKNLVSFGELNDEYRVEAKINKRICVRCDLCRICCRDSGAQAVIRKRDGTYEVKRKLCIGCSLCQQVCPVAGCITMEGVSRTA